MIPLIKNSIYTGAGSNNWRLIFQQQQLYYFSCPKRHGMVNIMCLWLKII